MPFAMMTLSRVAMPVSQTEGLKILSFYPASHTLPRWCFVSEI